MRKILKIAGPLFLAMTWVACERQEKILETGLLPVVNPEVVRKRIDDGIGLAHLDSGPVDHLMKAALLEEKEDIEGALLEMRRGVYDSDSVECLEGVTRLAKMQRKPGLEEKALQKLVKLSLDNAEARIRLSSIYLKKGEVQKGLQMAREAIAADPDSAPAHHLCGRAYLQQNHWRSAMVEFRKATELDPEHGYAWNNLGFVLLRVNEPEEAIEPLERAVELLPEVALVHNSLGMAYEKSDRQEEARIQYARAIELRPDYVKALVNAQRVGAVALNDDSMCGDYLPRATPEEEFGDGEDMTREEELLRMPALDVTGEIEP